MFARLKTFFGGKSNSVQPRKSSSSSAKRLSLQIIERRRFGRDDERSLVQQLVDADASDELNQKFLPYEEFNGPIAKREPTDKKCLYFPLTAVLLLLVQFLIFLWLGEPKRLAFGLDFRANPCGVGNLTARPYLYSAAPNVDLNVNVCLASCPNATNYELCLYRPDGKREHSEPRFCYSTIQSRLYGKHCLPVEKMTRKTVMDELNRASRVIGRLLGDGYVGLACVLLGFFAVVFLADAFFYLLRKPRFFVWGNVISFVLGAVFLFVIAGLFAFELVQIVNGQCFGRLSHDFCSSGIPAFIKFGTAFFFILACALLLALLANITKFSALIRMLGKIQLVYKLGFQLRVVSFLVSLLIIGLSILAFFFVQLGYSSGSNEVVSASGIDGGKVKIFTPLLSVRVVLVFDLLLFALIIGFVRNLNKAIAIFSTTSWYFSRKKESADLPVFRGVLALAKFHLGSVAYYSLVSWLLDPLKVICQFVFLCLQKADQNSDLTRFLISVFSPLLKLHHNYLRYIDMDFFQQTALFAEPFGSSSKRTFFLKESRNSLVDLRIFDWLERLFALQKIVLLGFVFLAIFIAIFVFGKTSTAGFEKIDFHLSVSIVFLFFAAFLACGYFETYFYVAKALCLCFLMDREMFVGDQMYCEEILQKFIKVFEEDGNSIAKDARLFGISLSRKSVKIANAKIQTAQYFEDFEEDQHEIMEKNETPKKGDLTPKENKKENEGTIVEEIINGEKREENFKAPVL